MLKFLIKKQMMETFRGFFFSHKNNKKRSLKGQIIWLITFSLMILGFISGTMIVLSIAMCKGMTEAGANWLFYLIMTCLTIVIGIFGSVFSTYYGLYQAKDNELLLSLPIKLRDIVLARLINIYLLGAIFSIPAFIPTLIVDWCINGITVSKVICGIALMLIVTLFIFVLSCLFGFVIAKVRLKVKNKTAISVLSALIFIGAYYLCYFKMSDLIRELATNAASYSAMLHEKAYPLYLFGSIGTGNLIGCLIYMLIAFVIVGLTWLVLKSTFVNLTTSTGKSERKVVSKKEAKTRSLFGTVLAKEFRRFATSTNYILNCGFGTIFIIAFGVAMAIKGNGLLEMLSQEFPRFANAGCMLVTVCLLGVAGTVDIAAPSVSLEGKHIWILQSLPVDPGMCLLAKMCVQLIVVLVPSTITLIITSIFLNESFINILMMFILTYVYLAFDAAFCTFLSIKFPNLTWTNELYPIKQSAPIFFGLFGPMLCIFAIGFIYLLVCEFIPTALFMLLASIVFAILAVLLIKYLKTKGAKQFASL